MDKPATQPRPRICIQCDEPITHGVGYRIPAVAQTSDLRRWWFVCYHFSCLPPALLASGYEPVTLDEAAA